MNKQKWTKERIKKLRLMLGKKQDEFAAILGFNHKQRISELENGKRQPSKKTILLLDSLESYAKVMVLPKARRAK